jgi:ribosome maturation factor RimP
VEGNDKRSLLYFRYMNIEQKAAKIQSLAEEIISKDPDSFLIDVKLTPGNNIQVFVDADAGLPLSRCIAYNRALYKQIEEAALFNEGDFALEVSSPGLEEPLKLNRQYRKNIGRLVEVVLKDGRKIEGKLVAAENEIVVEETKARLSSKERNKEGGQGKGKQPEVVQHTLLFDDIKSTKIQIVFN